MHATEQVLHFAKKAGATSADTIHIESSNTEIAVLNNEMDSAEQSVSSGIGLRVIVDGKQAVAHSSNLSEEGLKRLAEQTTEMAKAMPKSKYAYVNEHYTSSIPDLELLGDDLSIDQLKEYAFQTEAAALKQKDVLKSDSAWAAHSKSGITYATSTGFNHGYSKSSIAFGCAMLAGTKDAMENGYKHTSARFIKDLKEPLFIGSEAVRKAAAKVGGKSMHLGAVPVIFDKDVAARLITELLGAINGDNIVRGVSFLKDKKGEQIFKTSINITDNPHILHGFGSRPFDAEGSETKELTLIENGVLKTWLTDLRTAHELGETTTGHASRGLSSLPNPSSSNVIVEQSKLSLGDLMKDIEKGFFVTGLKGRGGEVSTGDYSIGAYGFLIENGVITKPLANMTMAGNVLDLFKSMDVANDAEHNTSLICPSIRVEGLTVSGA